MANWAKGLDVVLQGPKVPGMTQASPAVLRDLRYCTQQGRGRDARSGPS